MIVLSCRISLYQQQNICGTLNHQDALHLGPSKSHQLPSTDALELTRRLHGGHFSSRFVFALVKGGVRYFLHTWSRKVSRGVERKSGSQN